MAERQRLMVTDILQRLATKQPLATEQNIFLSHLVTTIPDRHHLAPHQLTSHIVNLLQQLVNLDIQLIADKPRFYQSFIDFVNCDQSQYTDPHITETFKQSDFRYQLVHKRVDARLIKEVAPYLAPIVRKPQKVSADQQDFYVAEDLYTSTHYICYKELAMIDIDGYKMGDKDTALSLGQVVSLLPHCHCQIQQVMNDWLPPDDYDDSQPRAATWTRYHCQGKEGCTYRYRLFRSRGGYHAFVVSHTMDYKSNIAIQLMLEACCDYFYVVFTHLRGWCVRLNRKRDEQSRHIYPRIGDVVRGKIVTTSSYIIPHLAKLVDLHIELADQAVDFEPVRG